MEDPAASKRQFRIRVMASHTRRDLDVLLEAIDEVWSLYAAPEGVDVWVATDTTPLRGFPGSK